jgi:hypothetical protein
MIKHVPPVIVLLPLILLTIFGIGCEEETTEPENSLIPIITGWQLPEKMVYNYHRSQRIVVTVEDAQGPADVPIVWGTILNNGTLIDTFSLWDDGSFYTIPAHPPWADSISGDLIPRDGVFSRRITGQFVNQPTDVTFRFEVTDLDGHVGTPVEATVEINANSAPTLFNPVLPDTLVSGFDSLTLSVTALDSDYQDSVIRVWLEVEGSNKGEIDLEGPDADHHWSITIDSSFAAGILGNYPFQFYAEDTYQEIAGPLGQMVYVENTPPTISNLVMPDTMILPTQSEGSDTAALFLNVDDDQTLLDIPENAVYFTIVRNDTIPNPTVYPLFDNGTGEDQIAGDGIYSLGIVLFWDDPIGKYTFTFKAKDMVEQESNPIIHDMWVIGPTAFLGRGLISQTPTGLISQKSGPLCHPFSLGRRQP